VDAEGDDYRLSPRCPCVDAGLPLTLTTAAGSGRSLPVADARWFYDGFGLPGETGDTIWVGSDRDVAIVTSRDVGRNLLVLDREIRWRNGAPVTLPHAGTAPDLGAIECGRDEDTGRDFPRIPPGVRWAPPTEPATPLVQADFEDATVEQWGFVWNLDRKRNTDYARATDTSSSGEASLRLFATADGAVLAGDVKPPVWNIDAFPVVHFAYRVPKGVPLGVWLDGFDTEHQGAARVCVGGTETRKTGGGADLAEVELLDDDQWHVARLDARIIRKVYPDLTHLQAFQLYTHRNASKGQQFWIDDFVIGPEGR